MTWARAVGAVLTIGCLAVGLAGCAGASDTAPPAGTRLPAGGEPTPAGTAAGSTSGATTPGATTSGATTPGGAARCPSTGSTAPPVTDGLPDLTLDCLGAGPAVRLSAVRGAPLLVNVWASWCGPCVRELPMLGQAARDYAGRVTFLGVNLLDDPDRARLAAADLGVRYPTVVDPTGQLRAALGVPGPPVTLLVRPDGTVAHRVVGEIPDRATLDALLAEYLGVAG